MNTAFLRKLILPLATLLLLLACALPVLPSPNATNPTPNSGVIQTIVVATAGAAQTQTALVSPPPTDTPTFTLVPSAIPSETPTPTATVIFIIPTITYSPTPTSLATATQSAGSDCELVSQTPANGTTYSSRQRFNVQWRLKNTGNQTWLASNFDFFYSSGRDMHDNDIYDLPKNVRPGGEVTFNVEMRAPGNAGTYTSNWILGTQREPLCTVSVKIVVK